MGLKEQIEEQIQNTPVLIYSKTTCPYCSDAKATLQAGDVEFKCYELNTMSNGSDIQDALESITG